ncbi:MAG: TonB-dependent receptor [Polyangiales bacterium]
MKRFLLSALIALAWSSVSHAQDAGVPLTLTSIDSGLPEPSVALGSDVVDVTIRKDDGPLGNGALITTINTLDSEILSIQTANDTAALLKRMPGVYNQEFNQGVTSTNVALRGYNTEDNNGFVKVLLDGIPTNMHRGQADLKPVFAQEIDHVDVVQGTVDPRYGLYNVAGNINVHTLQGVNARKLRLLGGSFGTVEPQLLYGQRHGAFNHTYFLGYRSSNGFRTNSRLDRLAGSGKWFYEPNRRLKVGLIVRGMKFDAESPGFLDRPDAIARPHIAPDYALPDAGKATFGRVSGHLDYELSPSLFLSARVYLQRFYHERNVSFDPMEQQTHRTDRELHHGAIATLTYRARGKNAHDFALEWGVDYTQQRNEQRRFNSVNRVAQGMATRSFDFDFGAAGSYLQASVRPVRPVKLVAAVRGDYLFGTLENRLNDRKFGMADYGVLWQPKLSASYAFHEGQLLYASYGRNFQVGTYNGAYRTANGQSVEASLNDGWEAGLRSNIRQRFSGRLAFWEQRASREIRNKPDMSGDLENIGKTRRYGFDVEASVKPLEWLSLWGAFSPVVAKQTEPGAGNEAREGKWLNHVPWFNAKGGIDFRRFEGVLISLWCYGQGDYYLTKENDGRRVGSYYTVNLDAHYQVTPALDLGLSVQNLTNNEYYPAAWFKNYGSAGEQYSPAPPVSAFLFATLSP